MICNARDCSRKAKVYSETEALCRRHYVLRLRRMREGGFLLYWKRWYRIPKVVGGKLVKAPEL